MHHSIEDDGCDFIGALCDLVERATRLYRVPIRLDQRTIGCRDRALVVLGIFNDAMQEVGLDTGRLDQSEFHTKVRLHIGRKTFHHAFKSKFCRTISLAEGLTDQATDRADAEDMPRLLGSHDWQNGFDAANRTEKIDLK